MRTSCYRGSAVFATGILMLALAGCASSGGTKSSMPSAGGAAASANKAKGAASKDAGLFTKMLHAVGLGGGSDSKAAVSHLPLRIYTATNLNAGSNVHGVALVLKVYHLRSLAKFRQANFNDFLDDDKTRDVLGSSLIDDRQMLLLPKKHYISTEKLPQGTHYIGFVALFRGPAARRWRFAYNVAKSAGTGITLGIHGCAMSSTEGDLATQLNSAPDSLSAVKCPIPGQ